MTEADQEPHGDIKTALQHAASLLQKNPKLAELQALEILKVIPHLDSAQHILGASYRFQGLSQQALEIMEPLAKRLPKASPILHELALCLSTAGRGAEAIMVLQKVVTLNPNNAEAWRSLGDLLDLVGDIEGRDEAHENHLKALSSHPDLITAASLLNKGEIAQAEQLARNILKKYPADVAAMRLLASIGLKVSQYEDAKNLLERCLELAPNFHLARHNYVIVLFRRQELEAALDQLEILLSFEPNNPNYQILKAAILVRKGDHLQALVIYEKSLKDYPKQASAQMSYGHTLKTVGRLDESIAAYRACIALSPSIGEAYWSLANLKTFRFSDEDLETMLAQVTTEGGDPDDQSHLAFALGKAYEDRKDFDKSFHYYKRANGIRRTQHRYDPKINIYDTVRQIKSCDAAFFADREGQGCTAPDPIFIVGLPRAGSTLLEQILASHSKVDGTAELFDIISLSRELGGKSSFKSASKYPEILLELSADDFRELGERYLETTRVQRGDTPFFIDKMPNNFQHIGLIHMILPNAKIIDARRHPMGGCFSGYKQLFARGQAFTYDLTDIGHYYQDYIKLMDHWDEVLPGRILRVQYEDMVADTENQIKRLLNYCSLEFEESCVRFYETDRAVRTPSSEQVRQPIYRKGLEQWRNFETHLAPLKEALGPVLERYPIE